MKCKKIIFLLGLLFSFLIVNAQLYTYPEGLRTGIPHNDDFTVRVRTKGGNGKRRLSIRFK